MFLAVIISIIFTQTGIWLAYYLDLTAGATIVLVAAAAFLVAGLLPGRKISK